MVEVYNSTNQDDSHINPEWQLPVEIFIEPQIGPPPLSQWKTVDKLLKLPVTKYAINGYKQAKQFAPRTISLFEYGVRTSSRPCRYFVRQVLEVIPDQAGAVCFVLNFKSCDCVLDTHWSVL